MFIVMFEWQMLAGEYGPARNALARARDAQAQQLMEGDNRLRSGRPYPGAGPRLAGELADPGTIFRELGAHREAQEARAGRLRLVPNQNPPG